MKILFYFDFSIKNYRVHRGKCYSCKFLGNIETLFTDAGKRNKCSAGIEVFQLYFTCPSWLEKQELIKL
jgi:hypothetical protein